MREVIIGVSILGFALVLVAMLVEYENSNVNSSLRTEVTTGSGQHVKTLPRKEFKDWVLRNASNIDIVSLAPVGDGSYGRVS